MGEPEVVIHLTVQEAVVLDALLRRYSDTNQLAVIDRAEQQALWNLQCLFEKLGDPSWPSLEEARGRCVTMSRRALIAPKLALHRTRPAKAVRGNATISLAGTVRVFEPFLD